MQQVRILRRHSSQFKNNYFAEICSGFEVGSYLRLIDSCVTQLKAQGPSRTCNECKEEEELTTDPLIADATDDGRDIRQGAAERSHSEHPGYRPHTTCRPPLPPTAEGGRGDTLDCGRARAVSSQVWAEHRGRYHPRERPCYPTVRSPGRFTHPVQGYLAHKEQRPPRTLQQDYAYVAALTPPAAAAWPLPSEYGTCKTVKARI